MTFLCPACHEVKRLDEGLLVMEHPPHSRRAGAGREQPKTNQNLPLVAIMCGPCTGSLVVDRAKNR